MMSPKSDIANPDKLTVLVVEDEPLIRMVVADMLRDQAFKVIEAATADEAWQHLLVDDAVDVVFTDHRMPGTMTGADLAMRIAKKFPAMPVVLTSGDFSGEGFPGNVLRKPYVLEEVVTQLKLLAQGNRDD